jgi:hypothetical protein
MPATWPLRRCADPDPRIMPLKITLVLLHFRASRGSIYEALTIFGKDRGTLAKSIGASLTRLKAGTHLNELQRRLA